MCKCADKPNTVDLPEATKTYYGRVFVECFLKAAGSDSIPNNIAIYINDEVERIVRKAAYSAGLELRGHWVKG